MRSNFAPAARARGLERVERVRGDALVHYPRSASASSHSAAEVSTASTCDTSAGTMIGSGPCEELENEMRGETVWGKRGASAGSTERQQPAKALVHAACPTEATRHFFDAEK